MKLKDIFKLEEAFNPSIYYDGRLAIGNAVYRNERDELYLNAKQTKKSNAYKEFIDKYYYEPLAKIVGKDSHDLEYSAALDTIYDKASDQKVTAFSLKTFLAIKIADIQIPCVNYDAFSYACDNLEDDEQILDLARECIREERKVFQDILKRGFNSPYYNDLEETLNKYPHKNVKKVLEAMIEECTSFLVQSKRFLLPFFQKPIDYKKFIECFDYDQLALIIVKNIVGNLITTSNNTKINADLLGIVENYITAVNKVRETNLNYDVSIKLLDLEKSRVYEMNINSVLIVYANYLEENPEVTPTRLTKEKIQKVLKRNGYNEEEIEAFDTTKKTNIDKVKEMLEILKEEQELLAEWEFIPKGTKEITESKDLKIPRGSYPKNTEEILRRFKMGRIFIEETDYLYKTEGKDKFFGYIAYIYPNGKVVFEKDYTKISKPSDITSSATYIMTYKDFVSLSKLTKQEIIKLISHDPTIPVRRVYHYEDMSKWGKTITSLINGEDYTEDVINFIKHLIETKELSHKRDLKC